MMMVGIRLVQGLKDQKQNFRSLSLLLFEDWDHVSA